MDAIGDRIKQVRKWAKLTQAQFAEEIGISQTHVSKIEKGVEHPSSTLIRLISMKYNVRESWLNDGVGGPSISWDVRTDEGAIAKYNAERVALENLLRTRTGKDLKNTVNAFSNLVSLLSSEGIDDSISSSYLEAVNHCIDLIEKLEFSTYSLGLWGNMGKDTYHALLSYRTDSEKLLKSIDQSLRDMNNLILKQLNAETEL